MANKIKKLFNRIYADFFMPCRLKEYKSLLEEALKKGYEINSIEDFWEKIKDNSIKPEKKYLILRHDIDTDINTAKEMFDIEKNLNIKSSYYFRLSTLDIHFMKQIEMFGGEASYHYEELALYAKRNGIFTKEQIINNIQDIQELFKSNLEYLREKTNIQMKIVASHGDFINRKLGIANTIILKDNNFRELVGIELEVYDDAFMRYVTSRCSDTHYPIYWKPYNPIESIRNNEHVIYILVHPRHWKANVIINAIDDIKRINEAISFNFRILKNIL
jgi:hypothetical protein